MLRLHSHVACNAGSSRERGAAPLGRGGRAGGHSCSPTHHPWTPEPGEACKADATALPGTGLTCWSHSGQDLVAIFTFLALPADMLLFLLVQQMLLLLLAKERARAAPPTSNGTQPSRHQQPAPRPRMRTPPALFWGSSQTAAGLSVADLPRACPGRVKGEERERALHKGPIKCPEYKQEPVSVSQNHAP